MAFAYYRDFDAFTKAERPPRLLTDDHVTLLGTITVAFSWLETQLLVAISYLLSANDDEADMVVAEMSFRNRLNLLGSLMRYRINDSSFKLPGDNPEKALAELLAVCQRAEELRNQVVHSHWEVDPRVNSVVRQKITSRAQTGLRYKYEQVSVSDLNRIANYIFYATECIGDVFHHFSNR